MIKKYEVIEFKGLNGTQQYHYCVIELADGLYYKGYDDDKIRTTDNVELASRITPRFAVQTIGFIQNFFDRAGNVRPENRGKTIPPLVGYAEAAEMLGWDKRKVGTYMQRGVFPEPIQRLASGPIWTYKQIEDYRESRP